tara:strand:+ start:475 stop:870 length:396 start_codon:yes stop_codon:yes gene_type:complete
MSTKLKRLAGPQDIKGRLIRMVPPTGEMVAGLLADDGYVYAEVSGQSTVDYCIDAGWEVVGGAPDDHAETVPEGGVEHALDLTLGELEEALDLGEFDGMLNELLAGEMLKKRPRKGAVGLIEKRIQLVSEG